ncbi:MAG: sugar phosphate isomerase/epimerase [Spirochaetia bacterium]|nr:sugar phosphate isomerase/epimerase [Spirochaetia bacterium]
MKFGAHAFVWEPEWNLETGKRVIAEAAKTGLDLVEIPLLHPEEFDSRETAEQLRMYGLTASYSMGLPSDRSLPEYPEQAESFLKQSIDVIAAAGGNVLTGVLYGTLGELPGRPPEERDYEILAEVLKSASSYGDEKGIRLGIEPVNRYETFLINTADQAVRLLDRIGSDTMFVHLDTYHLNIEEESFGDAIRYAGDRLGYIHLSESHRGTPGKGTVDWDDVFQGLQDVQFSGSLVMESFVKLNPDIARATCMWRQIVTDPDAMIRDGAAFLKNKAREYHLL